MNIKSLVLFSCLALTIVSLQAQTPNPKSVALAEELTSLMKIDESMNAVLDQITKSQEQMLDSKDIPADQKARQQRIMKVAMAETKSYFSWETIKPAFIEIYAQTFTPEELQGMIDFFKTPVGQKWIEKQPQLQMATMQKMQTLMAGIQPKMKEAIKRAMEQEPDPTAKQGQP